MRRVTRFSLYALAGLLGLVVVLALTAWVVAQSRWFRERVRARIVYELEEATGGRVELRSVVFDRRRLTVEVRDLVIHGTEGPGQEPLFRAASIQAGLKIISLLKQQIDIQSLVVSKPEVHLIIDEKGGTNLPAPRAARKPKKHPVETILDLAIRRFQLTDGVLRMEARSVPLNALGENLRVQVLYETAGPRYRGEISFRQLHLAGGAVKALPCDLDARLTLEKSRLELASLRLGFGESSVDASGRLEDFAAPRADLQYTARISLKDLGPALGLAAVGPRGTLALSGNLVYSEAAGYALRGKVEGRGLAFQHRGIRIENAGLTSEMTLTPQKTEFRNLTISALGGRISGRAELLQFRDFAVQAEVKGFSLEDLTRVPGLRSMPWSGTLEGPVQISGRLLKGEVREVRASARLGVSPGPGVNPLEGAIEASYNQSSGEITTGRCWLATRSSRLQFSGTLGRRLEVGLQSTDLRDFEPAIAMLSSGPVRPLPLSLQDGAVRFQGAVMGPLEDPQVQGRLRLTGFRFENHSFDALEASVAVSRRAAAVSNLSLAKGTMRLTGTVEAGLQDWEPEPGQRLSGNLSLRAPELPRLLAEAGESLPVTGELEGRFELAGTLGAPQATGRITVVKGAAYDQPFDRFEAAVRYSEGLLEVPSARLQIGPSQVQLAAAFQHPKTDWQSGRLRVELSTKGFPLARLRSAQQQYPGLEGRIEGQLTAQLSLARKELRLTGLSGQLALTSVGVGRQPLGEVRLNAETAGPTLNVKLTGALIGATVRGASRWTLQEGFPVEGNLEFTRLNLGTLVARLGGKAGNGLPFDGYAAGRATFTGAALEPQNWKAALNLSEVEILPPADAAAAAGGADMGVRNDGELLLDVNPKLATIRRARFRGKDTSLQASGSVVFESRNPWNLRIQGTASLGFVRNFETDLSPSGRLLIDAAVRGSLARPELYGRAEIQDGALNLAGVPNGLDKISAVVFLYRDRATIERFTAESGGGKVTVGGFVGLGTPLAYYLQAAAEQVRYRDPEGASVTLNAALNLTGTSERSVLGGEATITRISFNPHTDLGSLLARSAQPVSAPVRPGKLVRGIRLDVRIRTSPQARLESTLTRGLQAEADLRLRGDLAQPVLVGRVLINQGDVLFFGNKYTIDSGEITSVNPARTDPVVNLDLQTKVRGIDVTLTLNGPINKLNVSYRSDPPLQLSDIVGLLATGREPASSPGLSGSRSAVSQSWEQAGASALMSQAIASPLAGRMQRFFGVSSLKIDPSLSGTTNTPEARLTLEQQISQNLVFTYITNLTRAQEQTIRVEWGFTRHWSVVGLREENGLFGIDFLYRRRFK